MYLEDNDIVKIWGDIILILLSPRKIPGRKFGYEVVLYSADYCWFFWLCLRGYTKRNQEESAMVFGDDTLGGHFRNSRRNHPTVRMEGAVQGGIP